MAVDYNPDALATFSERFPDIPTFCGDIGDIDGEFDVMFLDLFANVSNQRIAGSLARASRRVAAVDDAFFVVALMQGRESKATMMELVAHRAIRESKLRSSEAKLKRALESYAPLRQRLIAAIAEDCAACDSEPSWVPAVRATIQAGDELIASERQRLVETTELLKVSNRIVRAHAVFGDLRDALHSRHIIPISDFNWGYLGNRVPMMVFGLRFNPCPFKWSRSRFYREVDQFEAHRTEDVDQRSFPKLGKRDVLAMLAEMPGLPGPPDQLLNVPRGTMAAYKAHLTRGTYATEAA